MASTTSGPPGRLRAVEPTSRTSGSCRRRTKYPGSPASPTVLTRFDGLVRHRRMPRSRAPRHLRVTSVSRLRADRSVRTGEWRGRGPQRNQSPRQPATRRHGPRSAGDAQPGRVRNAGQRVRNRVQVRADHERVALQVVAGVTTTVSSPRPRICCSRRPAWLRPPARGRRPHRPHLDHVDQARLARWAVAAGPPHRPGRGWPDAAASPARQPVFRASAGPLAPAASRTLVVRRDAHDQVR